MDLPNKSESPAPEPPKKDIKQVVTGAKVVDRSARKRFVDFLVAESPKALLGKIGRDIVVPRLKQGFEEAANNFLAGMLWGDSSNRPLPPTVRGTVLRGGGTNYNQLSSQPSALTQAREANVTRSSGNYKDIICPDQQRAEFLLANLYDTLNQYRVVAVGDLYEMAGITPAISDNAYGWTNLDGARISKVREGYLLELPRPSLI